MSITEHRIFGDSRGHLVAIEGFVDVPFEVKRVFYIYGAGPETTRGHHSHHQTRQYLISINGSCRVTLDDGKQKITYDLDRPNVGLLQDSRVWGTMQDFSSDCVLLVLASEHFVEADYIRDYDEFLKVVGA
jgi:hypothetical protein